MSCQNTLECVQSNVNSIFNSVSYRIKNIIIDPGDDWRGFIKIGHILLTHAHFDHIYGLNEVLRYNCNARVYTNTEGREALLSDKKNMSRYHGVSFICAYPERINLVENGKNLDLDGIKVSAYFTPGHAPSCITWVIGDNIFTGDSLIPGIKTVTNLPGGNKTDAGYSESLIKQLAEGRAVYPGHRI